MQFTAEDVVLLCGFLLLGLVVAFAGVTAYTAWVLTHPYRRTYASAVARGRAGEPSELRGTDGLARKYTAWDLNWRGLKLPVWDVAGDDPAGPVFVLSHGWGDSRIGGLTRAEQLAPMASRLVLWDMPGHGEAEGRCSLGMREAEALSSLLEQVGGRVVLYGWSLGGGVSISAANRASRADGSRTGASEHSGSCPVAVIAEAPYCVPMTPAKNVIRGWGLPWRGVLGLSLKLMRVEFDRAAQARELEIPLLVIHGEQDEVCPVEDGRAIADAAKNGLIVVIPGAGHHGLWTTPEHAEQCRAAVAEFVGRVWPPAALNSGHAQQSHG